jgi:hypothetical protein
MHAKTCSSVVEDGVDGWVAACVVDVTCVGPPWSELRDGPALYSSGPAASLSHPSRATGNAIQPFRKFVSSK